MGNTQPRAVGPQFTTAIFDRIGLDRYTVTASVLGDVCLGWTARGVSAIRRRQSAGDEVEFARWYAARTGRPIVRAVELDGIARAAQTKLASDGADVPLDLDAATPVERAVLAQIVQVPYGYARPCELVATELGSAVTSATVAGILAQNPVPLLVPCHRIVSNDCCVGAYVFGPQAQQRLLESEGLDLNAIERVVARGFRYIGCDDGSFCLPTCADVAGKIDRPGYVGLHSLSEAHEHGLHACPSCRPVAA